MKSDDPIVKQYKIERLNDGRWFLIKNNDPEESLNISIKRCCADCDNRYVSVDNDRGFVVLEIDEDSSLKENTDTLSRECQENIIESYLEWLNYD